MINRKPLVGVTGIIGSGKSTVSKLFIELGAVVFNADEAAHEVLKTPSVVAKIKEKFGGQVAKGNGVLDRRKLVESVFNDPQRLRELNVLIHPQVRQQMLKFIRQQQETSCKMIIIDAPLIYETDLYKLLDFVVVVAASNENCIRRVTQRSGLSAEEVGNRLAQQLPLAEKTRRADFIISNDGSREQLPAQVAKVFQKIVQIWSEK